MVKKRSPRRKTSSPSASKRASSAGGSSAGGSSAGTQRLNKVLASAGLGSRRKVEELIEQGRVQIDGEVVTDLACKVDPAAVKIKVDGELLKRARRVYFALNKPVGVLSTNYDPSGRMRVVDFVPDRDRVFSVGRLDQHSEGLMLLTNDGELGQRLAHPRFRIQKTYFVVVAGQLNEDELNKLRKGVHLAEGVARIDGAVIKRVRQGCTELEIVLSEGKNREIRRILARAGHKVVLLRRLAIGPLRLGQLPVGAARELSPAEVKALFAATEAPQASKSPRGRSAGKPASATGRPQRQPNPVNEDDDDDLLSLAYRASGPLGDDYDDDDDDLLFGGGAAEELSDDDFVSDFSGAGRTGSVLAFDDDTTPATSRSKPPRRGQTSTRSKGAKRRSAANMPRAKAPTAKAATTKRSAAPAGRQQTAAGRTVSGGATPSAGAPLRPRRRASGGAAGPKASGPKRGGQRAEGRRPASKRGKR